VPPVDGISPIEAREAAAAILAMADRAERFDAEVTPLLQQAVRKGEAILAEHLALPN
jgi:hypothetical protein